MDQIGNAFADGIRVRWQASINSVNVPRFRSVSDWLELGAYTWMPDTTSSVAVIDITATPDAFAHALAAEVARFSCGAYESLLDAVPPDEAARSLGWSLVRHYYASFYCAHALLRIAGASLTFLSKETVTKLNGVAGQYLGVSPNLPKGLYHIRRKGNNPYVLQLEHIAIGGGSHEDMWAIFLKFLVEVENTLLASQGTLASAQVAVDVSKSLRKQLCFNGKNGAWPSSVRNAINYRHGHGVWYPYEITARQSSVLQKKMNSWRETNRAHFAVCVETEDLGRLTYISNTLAQILLVALSDIARRAPRAKRSFADLFPLKFLRERKVIQ